MNGLASTQVVSRLLIRVPVPAIVVPGLLLGAAGGALFAQITPASGYVGREPDPADPADAGAIAATNMSQQIGAFVGTAVLNAIAAATASCLAGHHDPAGSAAAAVIHGYNAASVWAAALLVLAALIGGALITSRPGRTG